MIMPKRKLSKKAQQKLLEANTIELFDLLKNNKSEDEVLDFLNGKEVLLDAVDEMENTALHLMANRHYNEAAYIMIKRGADVNAQNFWNLVPLIHPTQDKNIELCTALLEAGANPQLINKTITISQKTTKPAYYKLLIANSLDMLNLYMQYFVKEDFEKLNQALIFALNERNEMGDKRYEHFDLMFRDDFLDSAKTVIDATVLNFDLLHNLGQKEAGKPNKI